MRLTVVTGSLQNLKAFVVNKPPLVIFTACLATFAIGFLVVANYVLAIPIKDPDVLDWNDVIERLVQWDLCASTVGGPIVPAGAAGASQSRDNDRDVGDWARRHMSLGRFFAGKEEVRHEVEDTEGDTVSMSFDLRFGEGVRRLAKGTEILWGRLDVEDLGLKSPSSSSSSSSSKKDRLMKVTLDFGARHGLVNCTSDDFCSLDPFVCVTFQGPVRDLPRARSSRQCVPRRPSRYDVSFNPVDANERESCAGIAIGLRYEPDPAFTVNLNRNEQVLMHRHLTYTSYFLFVMVITVLVLAACRSHSPSRTGGAGAGTGGGSGNGIAESRLLDGDTLM